MFIGSTYDWLTKHSMDIEYQQYCLLAYLQKIERKFTQNKLYPFFEDLRGHYENLLTLKEQKEEFDDAFPKMLTAIDLEKFRLEYTSQVEESELIEKVDQLIEEALPYFKHYVNEGSKIRNRVLEGIEVRPVGVLPLQRFEGYLFLSKHDHTRVYHFRLRSIEHPDQSKSYMDIVTRYLAAFVPGTFPTYEKMKEKMLRDNEELPNPATFAVDTELDVPHIETLLPLAKHVVKGWLTSLN